MERFGDVWVEWSRVIAVKGHFMETYSETGLAVKVKAKLPSSVTLKLDTGDTLMLDNKEDAEIFWAWWKPEQEKLQDNA